MIDEEKQRLSYEAQLREEREHDDLMILSETYGIEAAIHKLMTPHVRAMIRRQDQRLIASWDGIRNSELKRNAIAK